MRLTPLHRLSTGIRNDVQVIRIYGKMSTKCVKPDRRRHAQKLCSGRCLIIFFFLFVCFSAKESLALARNEKHLNCPTVKKQKQRHNNCVAAAAVFFFFISPFQIHALIYPCFIANDFWIRWRTKRDTMKRIRSAAG